MKVKMEESLKTSWTDGEIDVISKAGDDGVDFKEFLGVLPGMIAERFDGPLIKKGLEHVNTELLPKLPDEEASLIRSGVLAISDLTITEAEAVELGGLLGRLIYRKVEDRRNVTK